MSEKVNAPATVLMNRARDRKIAEEKIKEEKKEKAKKPKNSKK